MTTSGMAGPALPSLAAAFAGGVVYVPLESSREQTALLLAIGRAFNLRDSGDHLRERLVAHLAGQQVLLVLDYVEQLVEATPVLDELPSRERNSFPV